jgi:hypothetical protein
MAGLDPPTNLTVSPIRLSLFYQIQVPKPWTAESEARRICEALEQIPFAEQKGLDGVWFFERGATGRGGSRSTVAGGSGHTTDSQSVPAMLGGIPAARSRGCAVYADPCGRC